MKLTILGSGTSIGVPEIGCGCEVCTSSDPKDSRLRASAVIETGTESILIDCGPDFRCQMLRSRFSHLDALLITHFHYDHVGGIDDLRPFCRNKAFTVFAERRVADSLRMKYDYMFSDHKYPGVPDIDLVTLHRYPFKVGGTEVIPIRVFHYKLPVLGFRIGDMAYLTDFTVLQDSELYKLNGLKILVIDALRWDEHISHNNVAQALDCVRRIQPERTLFTHMSHHMGLHEKINAILPKGVELAYDGMSVEF